MTPLMIAARFVDAINAHDGERIASLMTEDHRFVNSLGAVVTGREAMRDGWEFYFGTVPDYAIEVSATFVAEQGSGVMLAGMVSGSYWPGGVRRPGSAWRTPAAVRAVVRDGKIAEWQMFTDNEPFRAQLHAAVV